MHTHAGCMDPNTPEIQSFWGIRACAHRHTHHTHTCPLSSRACYIILRGVYQRPISSSPKAVLSSFCLKLSELTDYLSAMGICLPQPEFASLYRGYLPSLRGSVLYTVYLRKESQSTGNPGLCLTTFLACLLSHGLK